MLSGQSEAGLEIFEAQLDSATISSCFISSTDDSAVIFNNADTTSSVTFSDCIFSGSILTSPIHHGMYIINTPDSNPSFRLNLINNTVISPPPSTPGYYIHNPGPASAFVLELVNTPGSIVVPFPVTIVGP